MKTGLDPESPLARKIWRVSQIIHCSPFADEVLKLNDAQLDFILYCYAQDHPKELTFKRASEIEAEQALIEDRVNMANVLTGDAKEQFKSKLSFPIPERYKNQGKGTFTRAAQKQPPAKSADKPRAVVPPSVMRQRKT